jgi:hypothetical protein
MKFRGNLFGRCAVGGEIGDPAFLGGEGGWPARLQICRNPVLVAIPWFSANATTSGGRAVWLV